MGRMLELSSRQLNILAKKSIYTYEDLLNVMPKNYIDFREQLTDLNSPSFNGKTGYVLGALMDYKTKFQNGRSIITCYINTGDGRVFVNFLGRFDVKEKISRGVGKPFAVFGNWQYCEQYNSYSTLNPRYFINREEEDYKKYIRLEPVYTKYGGIAESTMDRLREQALGEYYESSIEEMSEELEKKYFGSVKMPTKDAYRAIHFPKNYEEVELAKEKLAQNTLFEYAVALERQDSDAPKGTSLNISTLRVVKDIVNNLPFELSQHQKDVCNQIMKKWRGGNRVEALVQGDVGCGKTVVAELLLFCVASNGSQGIITAPTEILAYQHYEQINEIANRYGIRCAYYGGKTKAKERKEILQGIQSGEISIVVGTQALCSPNLVFKDLQVVIIDEEHRYGVEQKEALAKCRKKGCSVIKMTATPIPRTLSGAVLGSNVDVYSIHTMPSGRSPIQTAKIKSDAPIFSFVSKELKKGHQIYVICALVEESDSETMETVVSAEEAYEKYCKQFEPEGYSVGFLNGKMKKSDMDQVISDFRAKQVSILVSTTVVEVGVNNPNASVIVIENAERYGLATLHQLRGRVGRGNINGYCILKSPNADTCERLNVLVRTNDGFAISEADLSLRGGGNLIGTEQSGQSKYIDLIFRYETMYNKLRIAAKEYVCGEDEL